jgi:HK97 family phage major capsid protein
MTDQPNPQEFADAVKAEVKSTYEALDKKTTDLASMIDEAKKKLGEKADTTDIDGRIKDIQAEIKKAAERADEIERKANRAGAGDREERKSAGQRMAESDEYKTLASRRAGTAILEMKAIMSLPSPDVRNPIQTVQMVNGIIREPDRPLMVRDLLPIGTTTSMTIEYPREDVFTNAAAPVAEGALKPESNITFTAAKADVATIAHWIPASKQVLDDASFLAGYIDNRLREGLRQEEENQLLNGSGTGTNMLGLVTQATDYAAPITVADANQFDEVRLAKLQVRQAFYPADAVVLNPEDWAVMELLKDLDGNYLHAAVTSGAVPRLWGMRVVESDSLAPGEFLVGAFSLAAQIWDREQANVQVSTEDRDNFVRNMVTIRAEERLALTVYRPAAFVHGTFTVPTP